MENGKEIKTKGYIDNLCRSYGFYTKYQAPTKTRQDFLTEIAGLEREIEIAKANLLKAKR